jgi:hypothetical protein
VTRLRCSQMQDIAPDVALGLLTGEGRAAALAHLEDCAACRAEVASLAGVADELLLTGPEATPPGGFERRVLDRLAAARAADAPPPSPGDGPAPDPRPGGRRRPGRDRPRPTARTSLAAAAVAAVVVAAVLLGRGGPSPAVEERAEMTTGAGVVVGTATVRGGDPATVTVDVPGWGPAAPPGGTYWLAVDREDGHRSMTHIGTEMAVWEVPLVGDADEVTAVSVLDGEGRVWCSAPFPD